MGKNILSIHVKDILTTNSNRIFLFQHTSGMQSTLGSKNNPIFT